MQSAKSSKLIVNVLSYFASIDEAHDTSDSDVEAAVSRAAELAQALNFEQGVPREISQASDIALYHVQLFRSDAPGVIDLLGRFEQEAQRFKEAEQADPNATLNMYRDAVESAEKEYSLAEKASSVPYRGRKTTLSLCTATRNHRQPRALVEADSTRFTFPRAVEQRSGCIRARANVWN